MAKKFYGDIELKKNNGVKWQDDADDNFVKIISADVRTTDLTLVLPSDDPLADEIVSSDASGNLSFIKIANANVDAGAAIDYSKLNLTGSILNADLAGSIASSKIAELNSFSTTDLSEGTNLYYTDARFDTRLGTKDTDDLSEGVTNLYFTNARAKSAAVADSITDGITDVAPSQNAVFDSLALKAADADVIKKDGSVAYTGAQSMGSNKLTSLADGTDPNDAVNKSQLDAAVAGLSWKDAVRVASSSNITISGPGATIDGVTMSNGDRVLLYGQTSSSENGIYIFNGAASAMTRSTDMDAASEFDGAAVFVKEGTDADKGYTQTASITTVDTDAVSFTQFTGGGALTDGNGIDITGSTISVELGTDPGLEFVGTGLEAKIKASSGLVKDTDGLSVTLGDFSTTNLSEGTNLYYTDERVDDRTATLIQNGTGISWSYDDGAGTLTPTVTLSPFSTSDLSEGTNLYFTDARSIASPLTGFTSGAGTVTASDTILQAIQKLDGNISAIDSAGQWAEDWTTAQGTTKTVTHNLGTSDVIVQVYDKDAGSLATIEVDSVVRTDANTVTLTSSEAPGASSWRVMVLGI